MSKRTNVNGDKRQRYKRQEWQMSTAANVRDDKRQKL